MERSKVLISEAEIDRQRSFQARIRDMFALRQAHPLACLETFGCPNVRV